MTYTMRLGLTEPDQLTHSFSDPRLREYRVLWADDEQREGLAYVPGSSTRGVNLKLVGEELLIRLQTLASPADWLIGLRIAAVLAEGTGAELRLEPEGKRVPGDEILARLDADWLAPRCHLGTELITELVLSEGETVALQGWSDAFQIGPQLLAELGIGPDTDSEDAYVLLVKRMRRHQQLAADESIHHPTGMVITQKGSDSENEAEFCCASLPLNLPIWVDTSFLDALALWPESWQLQGLEPVWFPAGRLIELLAGNFERLDENQYLIGPLNEDEVLKRALALKTRLAKSDLEADYSQVQDLFSAQAKRQDPVPQAKDKPAFRFVELTPADFPLMLNWLQTPHVKRWWDDGDDTLEKVAAHYGPVDEGTGSYLLWLSEMGQERPIGYFQYYTCPDGAIGIDQFIGEPDCIGRGLGPQAIEHFVAMLRARFGQVAIELDPHPDNHSAIRCYEKVGFKTVSLSETTRLMRLEP